MSTDPRTAKDIFVELVSNVPPEEWENWLEQSCRGNEELRNHVRVLLRAHAEPGSFLQQPAVAANATILHELPISERPGTIIGPYKLLQQIGEGGMGVVFMAEQTKPLQRTVALKIIKPGMDTRQVIARFEAERQAVAMMDHPNIAKVLDAGTTDSGRPYFVMELLKGVPITRYCDDKHLPLRARLELFMEVCQAVQHAHQKGIIHRDIKPNNVLVAEYDNRAVPKVIDFGVAKATAQKLTERTMFTEFGQVLGTMEYMSPEQSKFNQLDIDTRSDIYSLGVMLYELLAGSTPFEGKRLKEAAFDEMLRIIREEEPQKPSTRLSSIDTLPSVAANRQTEPARLSKDVRGELDWIVMKALEKDRNRRYETASGFAADIERHLHNEPVAACPPSTFYRVEKFVRRNKGPVLAGALVLLALVGGIIGTTFGLVRAEQARRAETARAEDERKARQEARAREAETKAVLEFLENKFAQAVRPVFQGGLGPDATLRRALDGALPINDRRFADRPLIEARLRLMLGAFDIEQTQRARDLYERHRGPDHRDTVESMSVLSGQYWSVGRFDEAVRLQEEVLAREKAKLGPLHRYTLNSMTHMSHRYGLVGRYEDALRVSEELVPLSRKTLGAEHSLTVGAMESVAYFNAQLGRHAEAVKIYGEVLAIREEKLGPGHFDTLQTIQNLANSHRALGHKDDARKLYEQFVERYQATHGPRAITTDGRYRYVMLPKLAECYTALGRHAEAIETHKQAVALAETDGGRDEHGTLMATMALGVAYVDAGRQADALKVLDEVREAVRRKRDEAPVQGGFNTLLARLAMALATDPDAARRDPAKAFKLAEELVEREPDKSRGWDVLGIARYRTADFRGALAALEKDPVAAKQNGGFFLAMTHWQLGDKEEARRCYERAVERLDKQAAPNEISVRFRNEAAELLGVNESQSPPDPQLQEK